MRERRMAVAGLVALVMLLAWRGPALSLPSAPTGHVSLAFDLKQAEFTVTIATGAAALLAAAR